MGCQDPADKGEPQEEAGLWERRARTVEGARGGGEGNEAGGGEEGALNTNFIASSQK